MLLSTWNLLAKRVAWHATLVRERKLQRVFWVLLKVSGEIGFGLSQFVQVELLIKEYGLFEESVIAFETLFALIWFRSLLSCRSLRRQHWGTLLLSTLCIVIACLLSQNQIVLSLLMRSAALMEECCASSLRRGQGEDLLLLRDATEDVLVLGGWLGCWCRRARSIRNCRQESRLEQVLLSLRHARVLLPLAALCGGCFHSVRLWLYEFWLVFGSGFELGLQVLFHTTRDEPIHLVVLWWNLLTGFREDAPGEWFLLHDPQHLIRAWLLLLEKLEVTRVSAVILVLRESGDSTDRLHAVDQVGLRRVLVQVQSPTFVTVHWLEYQRLLIIIYHTASWLLQEVDMLL